MPRSWNLAVLLTMTACARAPSTPAAQRVVVLPPHPARGFYELAVATSGTVRCKTSVVAETQAELADAWRLFALPDAPPTVDFRVFRAVLYLQPSRCPGEMLSRGPIVALHV